MLRLKLEFRIIREPNSDFLPVLTAQAAFCQTQKHASVHGVTDKCELLI